jgi:hypothetical protein
MGKRAESKLETWVSNCPLTHSSGIPQILGMSKIFSGDSFRRALSPVRKVAEQSPTTDRWKTLLNYIVARIVPHRPRKLLKKCALLAG